MNLSTYLCFCVYFAAVSKEKYFLNPSSLALVELRGSGVVFLMCLCVSECWMWYCQLNRAELEFRKKAFKLRAEAQWVKEVQNWPPSGWLLSLPIRQTLYPVKEEYQTSSHWKQGFHKGVLKVSDVTPPAVSAMQFWCLRVRELHLCSFEDAPLQAGVEGVTGTRNQLGLGPYT